MINKKENEKTREEMAECACSMIDVIAKIVAADFDESGEFEYDAPHTAFLCDLIFKMYEREEYKEAMEVLAMSFMMLGMEDTTGLMAVAAAGYSDENGRFFLNRFFEYSAICDIYEKGLQMYLYYGWSIS